MLLARLCLCLLLAAAALAAGCAAPQRSTRLTAQDLADISTAMAQSLQRSEFLAGRDAGSEPVVISIAKVENISSDVIPEAEQWYVMQRLRSSLPILALRQQRNVSFVIPPERRDALVQVGLLEDAGGGNVRAEFGAQRRPTHVMTAVFRSTTRADARHRTDLYVTEFQVLDLHTGDPVWNDAFEFKRAAKGHVWD